MKRPTAAILAISLLASAPGCSFVFVKPPPKPPETPLACTSSVIAPVADTVLGTAAAAGAAKSIYDPAHRERLDGYIVGFVQIFAVLTGVIALVSGGSAYYGYTRTAACRDAREVHRDQGRR